MSRRQMSQSNYTSAIIIRIRPKSNVPTFLLLLLFCVFQMGEMFLEEGHDPLVAYYTLD